MKTHLNFIVTFSLCLLIYSTISAQSHFTLNATVTGFPDSTKVVINRMASDHRILEREVTLFLIDDKFTFGEQLDQPTFYSIRFQPEKMNDANFTDFENVFFWAENKKMSLVGQRGKIEFSEFSGSEIEDQYEQYVRLEQERKMQAKKLTYSIIRMGSSMPDQQRTETINTIRELNKVIDKSNADFISSHPEFYFSRSTLLLLVWAQPDRFNLAELRSFYNQLSDAFKDDVYGKKIADIINSKPSAPPTIGEKFINFNLPDSAGTQVSPADFVGKVLLIDFWGSGCGPCRWEHKNYSIAYEKFGPKGFEILSISIDSKRQSWLRAMRQDNMIWKCVWDKSYTVADKYQVNALPTNFLIDEQGNIIGKDLRGEELLAALESVVSKKH